VNFELAGRHEMDIRACFGMHRRGTFRDLGPQERPVNVRKAEVFFRAGWLAAAALALSQSGCGSGEKSAAAQAAGGAQTASVHGATKGKKAGPGAGEDNLADMVSAVSAAKAGPPVELKFALPTRPEVGQVMDLEVAVIPRAPVPASVSASFQVVDGLEIVAGSHLERVDQLVDGKPIRHVVKVLPKRDGIFTLTAVVSFEQANQEWARTFSIPVIAGEGLPEQVAKGP
jgi:hypothetical protein